MEDLDKMSVDELKKWAGFGLNIRNMVDGLMEASKPKRKPRTKKKEPLGKGMKPKDNGLDKEDGWRNPPQGQAANVS